MDFVAIDFETANEFRNSACSVGLCRVQGGKVVDRYYTLLRPRELYFNPFNVSIHGISEDDVLGSPTLAEAWPALLAFIDEQIMIAHNAAFDMSVLRHSLANVDLRSDSLRYACSCNIARRIWPDEVCHKLKYLAQVKKFPLLEHHNAEADAEACAELVLRLALESGASTVEGLLDHCELTHGEIYPGGAYVAASTPRAKSRGNGFELTIPDDYDISGNPLFGKAVVITQGISIFQNKPQAWDCINSLGGTAQRDITKSTDYLVVGNATSIATATTGKEPKKITKARKLKEAGGKIQVITEEDLLEMIFEPVNTRPSPEQGTNQPHVKKTGQHEDAS